MKGDKITFIDGKTFYKQYTKNEFLFLKMLHGSTNLEISITPDKQYITMPKGNVSGLIVSC
jgi:hypothetical protein